MSNTLQGPTLDSLAKELGTQVNAAYTRKLSSHRNGRYIANRDQGQFQSIISSVFRSSLGDASSSVGQLFFLIAVMLLAPLDLVLLACRALLYPAALLVWWTERQLGMMAGVRYACPLCHHSTVDPYVACPACREAQGELRPTMSGILFHQCRCGRHRWPNFGNYLRRRPRYTICRNTAKTFGCYLAAPWDDAGQGKPVIPCHLILASPSVRARHSLLAHMVLRSLVKQGGKQAAFKTPWRANLIEAQICEQFLTRSYLQPTLTLDFPAVNCQLARSLVLRKSGSRREIFLHSVAHACLESEEKLYREGPNWRTAHALIFVVDVQHAQAESTSKVMTHSEAFERIVRTAQHELNSTPNSRLPFKVAVVVIDRPAVSSPPLFSAGSGNSDAVEEVVKMVAPSLYALLRSCVLPRQLRYFTGSLPDGPQVTASAWVDEVRKWATGWKESKR